jgi:hypothetical protein
MNAKIQSAFETATDLRARIADRLQSMDPLPRKTFESLALFVILGTIYSVYLQALWSIPICRNVSLDFAYVLVLLKFLVLTGWPFALMALLDETWASNDAGRVFLATFITTNAFWMHKYSHTFCPFSFAFEIFPYIFSAMVAHAIGSRRQPSHAARITVEDYPF